MRCVRQKRGSALLKERLPSHWRCNVPAIRTLRANKESQKHVVLSGVKMGLWKLRGALLNPDQNPLQSCAANVKGSRVLQ